MGTSVRGFEFGHLRWGFALVLGCFHWPWVHSHYSYGWCSWYSSPLRPFESCESYTRKTCSVSEDPSKEDLVSIRICCAKRCWYNSAWCHVGANEFVSRVSNGRTEMWMNCYDFFHLQTLYRFHTAFTGHVSGSLGNWDGLCIFNRVSAADSSSCQLC